CLSRQRSIPTSPATITASGRARRPPLRGGRSDRWRTPQSDVLSTLAPRAEGRASFCRCLAPGGECCGPIHIQRCNKRLGSATEQGPYSAPPPADTWIDFNRLTSARGLPDTDHGYRREILHQRSREHSPSSRCSKHSRICGK